MTDLHGFQLLDAKEIPELKTAAQFYRHAKTGAQLLSLTNEDENKVFGVTFRTPPNDSTGVPHILEHSVLCGSDKYPVKEPFVELLKGSLQTFLNAFTYPDKTCYPVASQNLQDFYNLVEVYLDAVLHPRLTPRVFAQEGWHLDWPEEAARPTLKGVVFNEMKGAYSSPDRLLLEASQQSLFPDTTYGLDSGGDPRRIPDLDFQSFMEFYRRHYHPSNARFYFYGNDDPERRLRMLAEWLDSYQAQAADTAVPVQPPAPAPRREVRRYAAQVDGAEKANSMVTINWLLAPIDDPETEFALSVLNTILIGLPASPLRKALIESGLGEDLAGVGLENELRQMFFSYGLKGVAPDLVDRAERFILETITGIARDGIEPEMVEAALNTMEFHLRENNTGNYPQGLVLMLRVLTRWLYDLDPIQALAFEQPLQAVKTHWKSRERYFETLLDRHLVANPQRTTVVLEPDSGLRERLEHEERERIRKMVEGMDAAARGRVVADTAELKRLQEAPDSPEALATIPTLRLADLEPRNREIPVAMVERGGAQVLVHELTTRGIGYLDLGFDLHAVPQSLLSYLPLFGRALVEMGTVEQDYVKLSQRIGSKTGGIRPQLLLGATKQGPASASWLFLRGKAMVGQVEELCRILRDVLLTARFDNRERFRQMVLEEKARFEQQIIPNGHRIVALRLHSHFGEAGRLAEHLKGVSQLFFLRDLARQVEADWATVLADLEAVRAALIQRGAVIVNATADEAGWRRLDEPVSRLLGELPQPGAAMPPWAFDSLPEFEGLTIPSQVSYVGKAANLYQFGYRFHGSALVVGNILRTGWLWDRVRVRGGAYGAFSMFDRFTGTLTLASYRDPNLLDTIDVFDQSADFLCSLDLSADELRKAIIGVIGDLDQYLLPDAKGFTSLVRYLTGDDEPNRQLMRDQVLGTTAGDFKEFGERLRAFKDAGIVKVLSAQEVIDRAQVVRGEDWLSVTKVL